MFVSAFRNDGAFEPPRQNFFLKIFGESKKCITFAVRFAKKNELKSRQLLRGEPLDSSPKEVLKMK